MSAIPGVIGFLTPAMVDERPGGRMLNAFTNREDVDRISKGYACGNCCAIFDGFRLDCPLCGLPTHVTREREQAPELWQAHVDQRHADVQTRGLGPREAELPAAFTGPRSVDEFLKAVGKDHEAESVPLSKLRVSRHGRGRP